MSGISISLFCAALALAPVDRMQMADKMFAKGLYSQAMAEYEALKGEKTVSPEDIVFRIAECDRMLGKEKESISAYDSLLMRDIPASMRAVVLYRLACSRNDPGLFLKCEQTDPSGRYASFAKLKRAIILAKSNDATQRRTATGIFLELSLSKDKGIAEEAIYAAATLAYGDGRWNEAAILFGKLRKNFPDGTRAKAALVPFAWSTYLGGRYTECISTCSDSTEDDLFYLRAASMFALDRKDQGLAEFEKYLEAHPRGRYRSSAEIPVQRARYDAAVKNGDLGAAVQAAKLAFSSSNAAFDALRLAWAHEKSGAMDDARREYCGIVEKWPNDPVAGEALFANAMLDFRDGKWNSCDLALEEAIKRFPGFARKNEALYWRGVAAVKLGHEADGVARLKEALELGLSLDLTREANLIVAEAEMRSGKIEESALRYSKLIATGAADRMAASHLVSVLKLLSGKSDWEATLIGARALSSRSKDSAYVQIAASYEGRALEELSRFDEAIAAYRRALSAKAHTEEGAAASLALGILEFRKGDLAAAEKTLADSIVRNSGAEGTGARAKAYRVLADIARTQGDSLKAKGYETVLKELFGMEM